MGHLGLMLAVYTVTAAGNQFSNNSMYLLFSHNSAKLVAYAQNESSVAASIWRLAYNGKVDVSDTGSGEKCIDRVPIRTCQSATYGWFASIAIDDTRDVYSSVTKYGSDILTRLVLTGRTAKILANMTTEGAGDGSLISCSARSCLLVDN